MFPPLNSYFITYVYNIISVDPKFNGRKNTKKLEEWTQNVYYYIKTRQHNFM